jgi:hypothetical protein
VCEPLDVRVTRVRGLAHQTRLRTDEAPLRAAETYNLAALIASDCGMAELARDLCWRQFDHLQRGRHLPAAAAKLTLQPLVNLGRLALRDGDSDSAYQLFNTLYDATRSAESATIGGRTVDLSDLTRNDTEHRQLVGWLWTVMLTDATRALTRAGRWADALDHIQRHRGLGRRPLDGRQVAVLAHCARRNLDAAARLLADTDTAEPWEAAVAACLHLLIEHAHGRQPSDTDLATAARSLLGLTPGRENRTFRAALGLCLVDLAADSPWPGPLLRYVADLARYHRDAYAARDLLKHPHSRTHLDSTALAGLTATVQRAGIGHGTIPEDLRADLLRSLDVAEPALCAPPGSLKSSDPAQPESAGIG